MTRNRIASVTALLALTVLTAHAQQGAPPKSSLARVEVPEVSFNFGYVPQGSSISHTFWLRSVGEDTLRITDVRPG